MNWEPGGRQFGAFPRKPPLLGEGAGGASEEGARIVSGWWF